MLGLTVKKSALGSLKSSESKKWSTVKKHALPYLEDLVATGESHKIVLDDPNRFKETNYLSIIRLVN